MDPRDASASLEKHYWPLESGFLALGSEEKGIFPFYVPENIQASQERKGLTTI